MALSFKDVAEILKIIDSSDCEEVSLDIEGVRLVVRRGENASVGQGNPQSLPTDTSPNTKPVASAPEIIKKTEAPINDGSIAVRAPMVGTAYRRPSPDEDSFVEVGSRVEKGSPLCLIEVMKLFTTIEAPQEGTIAAIHMDDATLVEFDQVLFTIKPE